MQDTAPSPIESARKGGTGPGPTSGQAPKSECAGQRFIPVSRHGLRAKLIAMLKADGGDERAWDRALDCLAAWRHQFYRKLLLDLIDDYLPFSPDSDTASLIDLSMTPPRTVDTITVGPTPEGIKISPNGKYAAVVVHNGSAAVPTSPFYNAFGRVVLLGISGGRLVKLSEERIGRWSQGAAFSPDSNVLLVQNIVMLLAAVVIVINFVVDVLYAVIDPRLKLHAA